MNLKTTLCTAVLFAIGSVQAATVALQLPEEYRSILTPDGYPWSAYWHIDNGTNNTIKTDANAGATIVELSPGLYEVTGYGGYESEFAAIIRVEDKPGMQCFTTIAIDNMSDGESGMPSEPQGITYAGACQDTGATTSSQYSNTEQFNDPDSSAASPQSTDWCYTQPYCTITFDGKPYAYPYGWRIESIYYYETPSGWVADTPTIEFERQSDDAVVAANLRQMMMGDSCYEELPNGDMCFYPSDRQPITEQEYNILAGYTKP